MAVYLGNQKVNMYLGGDKVLFSYREQDKTINSYPATVNALYKNVLYGLSLSNNYALLVVNTINLDTQQARQTTVELDQYVSGFNTYVVVYRDEYGYDCKGDEVFFAIYNLRLIFIGRLNVYSHEVSFAKVPVDQAAASFGLPEDYISGILLRMHVDGDLIVWTEERGTGDLDSGLNANVIVYNSLTDAFSFQQITARLKAYTSLGDINYFDRIASSIKAKSKNGLLYVLAARRDRLGSNNMVPDYSRWGCYYGMTTIPAEENGSKELVIEGRWDRGIRTLQPVISLEHYTNLDLGGVIRTSTPSANPSTGDYTTTFSSSGAEQLIAGSGAPFSHALHQLTHVLKRGKYDKLIMESRAVATMKLGAHDTFANTAVLLERKTEYGAYYFSDPPFHSYLFAFVPNTDRVLCYNTSFENQVTFASIGRKESLMYFVGSYNLKLYFVLGVYGENGVYGAPSGVLEIPIAAFDQLME